MGALHDSNLNCKMFDILSSFALVVNRAKSVKLLDHEAVKAG